MPGLFLGSIGTLAETSDLQRDSFNTAFAEAGLDWHWSAEDYREMLTTSGGRERIAAYAEAREEAVDAAALHARKSALFQERLEQGVALRPGVAETLEAARTAGWVTALVTTTAPANVDALLAATGLSRDSFALVVDTDSAVAPKPDPEAYAHALGALRLAPGEAVAVEDNPGGLRAARAAGLACLAFPGAFHDPANFEGAAALVSHLALPQDMMAA